MRLFANKFGESPNFFGRVNEWMNLLSGLFGAKQNKPFCYSPLWAARSAAEIAYFDYGYGSRSARGSAPRDCKGLNVGPLKSVMVADWALNFYSRPFEVIAEMEPKSL